MSRHTRHGVIRRLQAWALGAGGAAGLVRCLELIEESVFGLRVRFLASAHPD